MRNNLVGKIRSRTMLSCVIFACPSSRGLTPLIFGASPILHFAVFTGLAPGAVGARAPPGSPVSAAASNRRLKGPAAVQQGLCPALRLKDETPQCKACFPRISNNLEGQRRLLVCPRK